MKQIGKAPLEFHRALTPFRIPKTFRHGLSAAALTGRHLFVANNKTITIERLTCLDADEDHLRFGDHRQFALHELLDLPVPPHESGEFDAADIAGIDVSGEYLWVVGSHSLKRMEPRDDDSPRRSARRLAKIDRDGNSLLLARIPIVDEGDHPILRRKAKRDGEPRTAAILRGDETGNELTGALIEDVHLRPFLWLPGTDNGFSIAGLAMAGERLLLGLRGPVLHGWAVILEVMPIEVHGNRSALKLMKFVPDKQPYLKHFIQLDGLGIRDLRVVGDDVFILAGPTMMLDGPVKLFRWPGGAVSPRPAIVAREDLELVGTIATQPGSNGQTEQAEGLVLLPPAGESGLSALVVYDHASPRRQGAGSETILGDIFSLSAPPV